MIPSDIICDNVSDPKNDGTYTLALNHETTLNLWKVCDEQRDALHAVLASLREMRDEMERNGPPLYQYEDEWNAAMAKADKLLAEHGR
ncbi:MAG: hypothetical protein WC655_13550 [Candidatus Hydrogenedentales bacterium]|jgi:hypothetical protein